MRASTIRYLSWAFWFLAVPLGLAAFALWLVSPGPGFAPESSLDALRLLAREQKVPALIVFFTFAGLLVYMFRYDLPGLGGRTDVPREHRPLIDRAGQFIEETRRLLRRHRRALEQDETRSKVEQLEDALKSLELAMGASPFDAGALEDSLEVAETLGHELLGRWRKSVFREYAESLLLALAVALLLRAVVFEAFKIPSGSMLPTLQLQDHIFVNKFVYGPMVPFTKTRLWNSMPPSRGDVVVFEFPDPNPDNPRQDYIKRVIALPGDVLEVHNGHPVINGWQVPSCRVGSYTFEDGEGFPKKGELYVEFLGKQSYLTLFQDGLGSDVDGPYPPVAQGEFWVLGDNRNNSSDSRAWNHHQGAGAPFQNVKGRAMFVWMSFSPDGAITYDRLLSSVMGHPRLPKGSSQELVEGIERCLTQRPAVTEPPPPPAAR